METKANYVLIGFFTLAVLAATFGFVHWFRNTRVTAVRSTYDVVFQGSVGGLRKGSTVAFNGMRVGEVADLQLDKTHPKQVLATLSVDSNVPTLLPRSPGVPGCGQTRTRLRPMPARS